MDTFICGPVFDGVGSGIGVRYFRQGFYADHQMVGNPFGDRSCILSADSLLIFSI